MQKQEKQRKIPRETTLEESRNCRAGERAISATRGDAAEVRLEDSYESNPHLDENSSDLPLNARRELFSSASAKKLQNVFNKTDEDAVERARLAKDCVTTRSQAATFLGPEIQGYRLVDVENLRVAMVKMHKCKGGKIIVKELEKSGLGSTFLFECSVCAHTAHMNTAKQTPGKVRTFDINRRSVFAAGELGIGREGLATLCEIMNLPAPVYNNSFSDHMKFVHESTKACLEEKLTESARKLRHIYTEKSLDVSEDSVIDVPVSFDGTWSKRGFTANFGIGFVISCDTGEVLDYCVLSKTCDYCKQSEKLKEKDQQKFEGWKKEHEESGECQKNFYGSSPAMEAAAATIIWERSIKKHRLQYVDMVCDGDSKSFNTVWDIYSLCNKCKEYEKYG